MEMERHTGRRVLLHLNTEIIEGIVLLALTGLYFRGTRSLPPPFTGDEPGPAYLPLWLTGIAFACAIALLIKGIRRGGGSGSADLSGNYRKPLVTVVLTVAYVAALFRVGYWISTLAYTTLIALEFEYDRSRSMRTCLYAIAFGAGSTLITYTLYAIMLGIRLP